MSFLKVVFSFVTIFISMSHSSGQARCATMRLAMEHINNNKTSGHKEVAGAQKSILEIDLDTINAIAQETFIVDTNVLALTYLQYKTVRLSVIHYQDWEKDIQSTRMIPDIPGDPNKESEEAA